MRGEPGTREQETEGCAGWQCAQKTAGWRDTNATKQSTGTVQNTYQGCLPGKYTEREVAPSSRTGAIMTAPPTVKASVMACVCAEREWIVSVFLECARKKVQTGRCVDNVVQGGS